ncbi:MAG: aminotransferase class I/II-fold pyridoxal phosphate-dependent enzyme [Bacteroidetes bacterium]|nr:aminotransferase class I/II-fold pyridoxal phosphate-dependent enzyme [Bacteroidota bacterium]
MKYWKKLSHAEQDLSISAALRQNVDFKHNLSLGIPASKLDSLVFHEGAPFLKDAPLLRSYVQNPNHIGCHTLGDSETFFSGTQQLEREVIDILGVDLLKAAPDSIDGYIAAGGTEANIQACWIYRNRFLQENNAQHHEIALLASEDTHYSVAKASNLLHLPWYSVPVEDDTRKLDLDQLALIIRQAKANGVKYFIVIANMATTMFGSVDDPDDYVTALQAENVPFYLHIDGAFGGFVYPVSLPENNLNFTNPYVSSITLDAHKMLQAPYGTGVFLTRKGMMRYVYTEQAQYVNGMDITLSGSRSGANAIAVWMILSTYGPYGYLEKINKLLYRTKWLCKELEQLGIPHYRHPNLNIVAIRASAVPSSVAEKYGLVPDTHQGAPNWYKIVVMEHVEIESLQEFLLEFGGNSFLK